MASVRVLTVIGTRPEAIKMAPVISAVAATSGLTGIVCATGQHRQMLDQVLEVFRIRPDHDLDLMQPGQTLNSLTSLLIQRIDPLLVAEKPDVVLVHGDTTTAMAAALAAFHRGIAVGHVEAGLRTYDMTRPFPEEMNRRVIDVVARFLFAPTASSADNLRREELASDRIVVTGNTVIDALFLTVDRLRQDVELRQRLERRFSYLDPAKKLVLVTGHRRESFGEGFQRICDALARIAGNEDAEILYPVHMNPQVDRVVRERLRNAPRIHLIEPVDYLSFIYLLDRAHMVLTDSGGVQEEAAALGKRVAIMRDVTERPEGVEAGVAVLVGTDVERICAAVQNALGLPQGEDIGSIGRALYGDGRAAQRIAHELLKAGA
jgi:UDP-N-acetylglucosamine 2-epimerase (non-hydrolysing)